jgi:hypothetical protein
MSATGGNGMVLSGALRDLEIHWENLGGRWKDAARKKFEVECIEELRIAVRTASNAIAQIEILLDQVRRECS